MFTIVGLCDRWCGHHRLSACAGLPSSSARRAVSCNQSSSGWSTRHHGVERKTSRRQLVGITFALVGAVVLSTSG